MFWCFTCGMFLWSSPQHVMWSTVAFFRWSCASVWTCFEPLVLLIRRNQQCEVFHQLCTTSAWQWHFCAEAVHQCEHVLSRLCHWFIVTSNVKHFFSACRRWMYLDHRYHRHSGLSLIHCNMQCEALLSRGDTKVFEADFIAVACLFEVHRNMYCGVQWHFFRWSWRACAWVGRLWREKKRLRDWTLRDCSFLIMIVLCIRVCWFLLFFWSHARKNRDDWNVKRKWKESDRKMTKPTVGIEHHNFC